MTTEGKYPFGDDPSVAPTSLRPDGLGMTCDSPVASELSSRAPSAGPPNLVSPATATYHAGNYWSGDSPIKKTPLGRSSSSRIPDPLPYAVLESRPPNTTRFPNLDF